jgi:hypothetical protein
VSWIAIELDRTTFRPGETVSGRFASKWDTRVRAASARLIQVERTTYDRAVRFSTASVELERGQLAAGRPHPFSVALPPGAMPTLAVPGAGDVTWFVELRLDRFGPDDVATAPITVLT